MADLVTIDDLRNYLRIPNIDATNAAPVLAGISSRIRTYTGRAWEAVDDEVVRLEGTGSRSLLLPKLPVRAVTSIVEDPAGRFGAPKTLVADVDFEWSEDGRVRRVDGAVFSRRLRFYEFTYSHGEVPDDDVKLVALRVCARAAVNPEGLAQESTAGYMAIYGQGAERFAALGPVDERELDPYRVTT